MERWVAAQGYRDARRGGGRELAWPGSGATSGGHMRMPGMGCGCSTWVWSGPCAASWPVPAGGSAAFSPGLLPRK